MYYKVKYHPKITRKIEDTCNIFPQILTNKTPPAGHTGGLSAVTLPFSLLKLGRKVSGDSPPPAALLFRFLHTLRTGVCVFAQLSDIWCCDDALPASDVQFAGQAVLSTGFPQGKKLIS